MGVPTSQTALRCTVQQGGVCGAQLHADHVIKSGSNGCLLHGHNSFELLQQREESKWERAGDVQWGV